MDNNFYNLSEKCDKLIEKADELIAVGKTRNKLIALTIISIIALGFVIFIK